MSYLVLARKWRPQTFDDVIGQEPVVRTLRNALAANRVAHAMIFSGVRGVGKTTLARIMAKALNCRGEGAPPCNSCESCREITGGGAVDLHEIDGASNRGIQEIRELKENIRFFPTSSRYKIIIIDEVHMLTTEAFNALLKTLEEPPEHVFFMFATTELHKVPITILSRCQRYELKRVSFQELAVFFTRIAAKEKVDISEKAIRLITREADGSVRDGLSLLDQVFSFSGQSVQDEDVTQVLGVVDRRIFESLARALLSSDVGTALTLLNDSFTAGVDHKRFAQDLLHYFRALLIFRTSPQPQEILELSDVEMAKLKEIATEYSAETLYQAFHLILKGVEELQYASQPRMVLEMMFIKATQAGQVVPVTSVLERLDSMLEQAGGEIEGASLKVESPKEEPVAAVVPDQEEVKFSPPLEAITPPVEAEIEMPAPAEQEVVDVHAPPKKIREHWENFIAYVMDRKKWMAHVLRMCSGAQEEGRYLVLKYDDKSDCLVLQNKENLKLLTEFAQDFFQKEFSVKINIRGSEHGDDADQQVDRPQAERRALANDPLVQAASEVFGGQVVSIRTGPRSR